MNTVNDPNLSDTTTLQFIPVPCILKLDRKNLEYVQNAVSS